MDWQLLLWSTFFFRVRISDGAFIHTSDAQDGICHSCAKGGASDSCYCDNMCALYKDCCFDAPIETTKLAVQTDIHFSCLPISFRRAVYAVDLCRTSWNGPQDIQTKCEGQEDFRDIFFAIPVTDTMTNITYRNRYCAECNDVDKSRLSSFSVELEFNNLLKLVNTSYGNITEDFILQNLIYVDYSWGVYHWDHRGSVMSFVRCSLSRVIPPNLSSLVRKCDNSVRFTCADDWNDDLIQQNCLSSNMNIVYDNYIPYRNVYCAACNYVSTNDTRCDAQEYPEYEFSPLPRPSFSILLDLSSEIQKTRCPAREIYDSHSKKCRRLICTNPKEVPWYGKCTEKAN